MQYAHRRPDIYLQKKRPEFHVKAKITANGHTSPRCDAALHVVIVVVKIDVLGA
jgi:hypothetical protein